MLRINYQKLFYLFFLISLSKSFYSQNQNKNYPKNYFIWPVNTNPGINANFGELRPDHFHMGIDGKTDKKENLEILAAAEGYVSKIKIEPGGFGRAIYINHPNGFTTLYAHLNNFFPALEKWVTEYQYKNKTWRVDIDNIPDSLFKVAKGQFIAYSGNTGGSLGPHLHFEIRDTKSDKVLNPLFFGFKIEDKIPPSIQNLFMYDRCISVYEQEPKKLLLKKIGNSYNVDGVIKTSERVSFGVTAFDQYTGSTNQNGIYEGTIFQNERPLISFEMDSIDYDETRYINAHIDYKYKSAKNIFIQHLSRLPGHSKTILYKEISNNGVIELLDDSVHNIKIRISDVNGNSSFIFLKIQRDNSLTQNRPITTKCFYPLLPNYFEAQDFMLKTNDSCIYDTVRTAYTTNFVRSFTDRSKTHQLFAKDIPAHTKITVGIKNDTIKNSEINNIVMLCIINSKTYRVRKPKKNNAGFFEAEFKNFGQFKLVLDTIPPKLIPRGFKQGSNISKMKELSFDAFDNFSDDMYEFTATVNGQWLRFNNDKFKKFSYKIDDYFPKGTNELKIEIKDVAGNVGKYSYMLTRE